MISKLTAFFLLLIITVVFSAFYKNEHKPSKGIKFKMFTTRIINDTLCKIEAVIDNGEREREFTIICTSYRDSIVLRTNIEDWYKNFSKTYTATINLK